jgi:signal recognition particle subunit SRP54
MFDRFSQRLSDIFSSLNKVAFLTNEHVDKALREIRIALIEADVSLETVKDFIDHVKTIATGQATIKSVDPVQQVIKIVHDQLVQILGSPSPLNFKNQTPRVMMLVGLQGSGKTTTCAKLAKLIEKNHHQKVLLVSVDIYRPAAQEQLKILAQQISVDFLSIIDEEKPLKTVERSIEYAKTHGIDTIILDTAGRLHIDDTMMEELKDLEHQSKAVEVLLVCDAMTGQDAVKVAKSFSKTLSLSGIILTRCDGDGRGGAALSMRHITKKPIKFLGVGERIEQIEVFDPQRLANRIFDKGDIVGFVEKAASLASMEETQKLAKKLEKGHFDLNDMVKQLEQMLKLGGIASIVDFLPGMGKVKEHLAKTQTDNRFIKRQIAIVKSMTPKERKNVGLLNASRKRRIASGAGVDIPQVNKLIKQYQQMQQIMKKVTKSPKGFLRGGFNNLFK